MLKSLVCALLLGGFLMVSVGCKDEETKPTTPKPAQVKPTTGPTTGPTTRP